MTFIEKIVAYMRSSGYVLFEQPGELNVVYIEGVNADGSDNSDAWDRFNDRRIVFDFVPKPFSGDDGNELKIIYTVNEPRILHNSECTTEPGRAPTFSLAALRRGGIFRIAFGQYLECWKMGFHKGNPAHPALCQIKGSKIHGFRDRNRDGKRTGDKIDVGSGINQHSTRPGFAGLLVGFFSEGCLVARHWADHIRFIELMKTDVRYQADASFKFSATVIPGDAMNRMFASCTKSCSPGDWKPGGRCDLNGCYHT